MPAEGRLWPSDNGDDDDDDETIAVTCQVAVRRPLTMSLSINPPSPHNIKYALQYNQATQYTVSTSAQYKV